MLGHGSAGIGTTFLGALAGTQQTFHKGQSRPE